ncbi:MAG: hypothetical protein WBA93_21730 [Microcoleaceae cyanobacterium]
MKKINQIKLSILARGIISLIVTSQPNLTEQKYSKAVAQTQGYFILNCAMLCLDENTLLIAL